MQAGIWIARLFQLPSIMFNSVAGIGCNMTNIGHHEYSQGKDVPVEVGG